MIEIEPLESDAPDSEPRGSVGSSGWPGGPPRGEGPAPFPVDALFLPARVRLGDTVLSGAARLRLEAALSRTARILSDGLDRAVRAAWDAGVAAVQPEEAAFGCELDAGGARIVLLLDGAAARAIVDRVEDELAEVRGHGAVTEAELGLLEYAGLLCLDELSREGDPGVSLRRFLSRREVAAIEDLPPDPLPIDLSVAGRLGRATLWVGADLAGRLSEGGEVVFAPAPARGRLSLRFTLPIAVDEEPMRSVRAGDLLLIGGPDLLGRAGDLIANTGWRVSSGRVECLSPFEIRVRRGALDPEVHDPRAYVDGRLHLVANLGETELCREDFEAWRAGAALAFTRPEGGRVDLLHGPKRVGAAELVRHRDEVALRLLEIDTGALGEA